MAEGYRKETGLIIFKFNEITEMSFQLKETVYLKNKDNLQINSRRHASVIVKKKKKVTELKKLFVSMRKNYESGKGYYEIGKERSRFKGN